MKIRVKIERVFVNGATIPGVEEAAFRVALVKELRRLESSGDTLPQSRFMERGVRPPSADKTAQPGISVAECIHRAIGKQKGE